MQGLNENLERANFRFYLRRRTLNVRKTILALLALTAPLVADYGGYVDALYWTPIECSTTYAIATTPTVPREIHSFLITDAYDWGVRGGVNYACDCGLFDLSYLYFQSTNHASMKRRSDATISSPLIIVNDINAMNASVKTRYQNVTFAFARNLCCACQIDIDLVALARWAQINHDLRVGAVNDDNAQFRATVNSEFNGGGVGLGAATRMPLCYGLALESRLAAMMLIGERSVDGISPQETVEVRVRWPKTTTVAPGIDAAIEINRVYQCGCLSLQGHVGYELHYYWNPIKVFETQIPSNQVQSGSQAALMCKDLGFGGLYFGIEVTY